MAEPVRNPDGLKAWLVREKDEFAATVVFAETRGKAKAIARYTDACEDVPYTHIQNLVSVLFARKVTPWYAEGSSAMCKKIISVPAEKGEPTMDVREKLVELLNGVLTTEDVTSSEQVADHLIANGVTVQEWISVKDRLPEESGDYLVILDWGKMCALEYSKVHQAFNASDSIPNDSEIFCTHWMPMPKPPKGE